MQFNEQIKPILETPGPHQCLAMIRDFSTSKEFRGLSLRHKEYIARIELYFLNQDNKESENETSQKETDTLSGISDVFKRSM